MDVHSGRVGLPVLGARAVEATGETRGECAPVRLEVPAPGIEVWYCELAWPATGIDAMRACLAPAELARAARFGRPALRDRYIVGRGTLRHLLGARLALAPEHVDIQRGHRGRPHVPGAGGLDFNVSHTGDHALIGIVTQGRIGVDVEHEARQLNVEGVARKFMAPAEQAMLAAQEPDRRRRTLLRLWTCKEAMSKATGDALSAPFRQIDVALDGGARVAGGPPPYAPGGWTLHALRTPGDHLATIALWQGP
ncbi:MAG: 4'-phosphopantetheinyl transferase superfamily protein [Casimicrobiaceae bacterium]